MKLIVTGCKNCPFYVDTRDLNHCYHPSVTDIDSTLLWVSEKPRIGKDVFDEVFRQKKYNPDWCPLIIEPITFIGSEKQAFSK